MKPEEVLRILSAHKNELQEHFGVRSLSLFGSVARDEATETSDVDVLVEFGGPQGYFGLIPLQEHLEGLLAVQSRCRNAQSQAAAAGRDLGGVIHVA